jgi:RNA polymerase sigma factor (TIGR02999 family)
MSEVTQLLNAIDAGDPKAAAELLPLVYQELRRVAAVMMARESQGQTLQPTALVHEAWLRLVGEAKNDWTGRRHFFAAAAEAMRRILIEKARSKSRIKRGGGWERINLEGLDLATTADDETLLVVNEALERLEGEDPMKANLVKLRFFAGLTAEEAGAWRFRAHSQAPLEIRTRLAPSGNRGWRGQSGASAREERHNFWACLFGSRIGP